jgi:all-trans-retinol 13,14-reductase
MQTTGEYLDHHFKSSELKALLASQWADYGLPPSESAFALHALVVRSYFQGGWFPDKGASRIARTFEVGIEENRGAIKVCQEVTQILTEGTQVVGVKALNGQRHEPIEVEYRAPIVISDAGAVATCKCHFLGCCIKFERRDTYVHQNYSSRLFPPPLPVFEEILLTRNL